MCKFVPSGGLAVGVLVLAGCLGCGTGEYEKRLNNSIVELKSASAFFDMHPIDTMDVPVTGKVPNFFNAPPLLEGAQVDGAPVDPRRINPPEVSMAGLKLTYEGTRVDGANGKLHYYCYIGVADQAMLGGRDLATQMFRQAQGTFGSSIVPLTAVQCETPEGRTVDWRKFRGTAELESYYVDAAGATSFPKMNGVLEFYFRQEGNYIIVIGWYVPESIQGTEYVDLDTWAPRVAGTMTLTQPSEGQ